MDEFVQRIDMIKTYSISIADGGYSLENQRRACLLPGRAV